MTILRHYKMTAAEGRGSDLHSTPQDLAAVVRCLPGCDSVRIYADMEDPRTYVFIEDWRSLDDHEAAGRALGKEAFAAVAGVLSGPPEGRYLGAVL